MYDILFSLLKPSFIFKGAFYGKIKWFGNKKAA